MHRVHIHFREDRGGCHDGRGNEDVLGLAKLAEVTSADKPYDVTRKLRPPESFTDDSAGCVEALVAELVVR